MNCTYATEHLSHMPTICSLFFKVYYI